MELKEAITHGESETIEFKENFGKETIETVVAFANKRGGQIVIGLDDKGNIKGASIGKETLVSWNNEITQAIEPKINITIHSEKFNDKNIVAIEVPEAPIKPVCCKGRCFRRVEKSNRLMVPHEISEMHISSTGASWDSVKSEVTEKEIDEKKVKNYIFLSKEAGRRNFKEDIRTVLKKLELLKNKPTWACVLLFGKEPQRILSQSAVHCGRFKLNKVEILDDLMIEEDLILQIESTMKFIKRHISVKYEFEGTPRRKEIWDYPLKALREAVINAIIHRDYTISANVQIEIYDDRIEIWNPGKLPYGVTINDLYRPDHKSVIRNKQIAQAFYDIGFIEKYGSGTTRIIELCESAGLPKPEFKEISGGFMITFRKDIFSEEYLNKIGLNERQVKAVKYVKEKGRINNSEYQKLTETSKQTASRDLEDLQAKGIFIKIGKTGKGTFYQLKGLTMGSKGS